MRRAERDTSRPRIPRAPLFFLPTPSKSRKPSVQFPSRIGKIGRQRVLIEVLPWIEEGGRDGRGQMRACQPAVHPVEAPPAAPAPTQQGENAHPPRGVRMKDPPGAPGTTGGLGLRLVQAFFAAAALSVMASTNEFPSVSAFCYLVAAAILQCLWSLSLAIVDIYALLVKRSLRNSRAVCIFTIGDGITGTLTLGAACASAGITVLIGNDMNMCAGNHCASFETATAMAFISWFALAPSCILNFWSMASR